ncbi:hypothetical protein D081_1679 [Anaerovibrio sp. JC8]|uniref:hypothetical protein n=1 Tax=Anaerovibrio sp. JC8 TaxID=1240085 RepID=UPI000A0ADD20|nr:hypothetical protein [Anaerovibrio sp. JC8]ORT99795.1 hypothetical protein D081_1679 [Anaerovibrio sp. JC8]
MAKKIKFALEMANGVQVRTIEELRDNFDQGKAMEYFVNGKLVEWLEDRYYDEEAEAISEIEENAPDAAKKICKALGVEYKDDGNDMEDAINVAEKTAKLKKVTNDEAILKNAGYTAFDQEDLADLLDADAKTIYLYGDVFSVPVKRISNVKFVGILESEPKIKLPSSCTKEMLGEKKIVFEDVLLPKEFRDEVAPAKSEENTTNSIREVSDVQFKVMKKAVYSGMKKVQLSNTILNDEYDLTKNKFFTLDEYDVHEIDDEIDEAVYYMCGDKYSKDDIILLVVAEDFSSGFAFTRDALCIISDLVDTSDKYEYVTKAIIKYFDIIRVDGEYDDVIINKLKIGFSKLYMNCNYEDFGQVILNVCNVLNVKAGKQIPDGYTEVDLSGAINTVSAFYELTNIFKK